jgi:hypothetical protein
MITLRFELSPLQKTHLDAAKWLISTDRKWIGTGRTTTLAVAFLEMAAETPYQWITIQDHYPFTTGTRSLMSAIRTLVPAPYGIEIRGDSCFRLVHDRRKNRPDRRKKA